MNKTDAIDAWLLSFFQRATAFIENLGISLRFQKIFLIISSFAAASYEKYLDTSSPIWTKIILLIVQVLIFCVVTYLIQTDNADTFIIGRKWVFFLFLYLTLFNIFKAYSTYDPLLQRIFSLKAIDFFTACILIYIIFCKPMPPRKKWWEKLFSFRLKTQQA